MDRAWINAASKLEYRDPKPFLQRLRALEPDVARSNLPAPAKSLRTNSLKQWRETRDAALFCVGIADRIGQPVYLARSESQDYDFVATWIANGIRNFAPVQLKEVVPSDLNSDASIQRVIDSLPTKYVDSTELTVAITLNQQSHFNPSALSIPNLEIAALWVFGALAPDNATWGLWGDFLDQPFGTRFEYPP